MSCARHLRRDGKHGLDHTETCTCVVDRCRTCGGRHVGALPPIRPCPRCGMGHRYAEHHACPNRARPDDDTPSLQAMLARP